MDKFGHAQRVNIDWGIHGFKYGKLGLQNVLVVWAVIFRFDPAN